MSALSDGGLLPRASISVPVQFAVTRRSDDDHRGHGHGAADLRGKDIDFDIRVFAGSF